MIILNFMYIKTNNFLSAKCDLMSGMRWYKLKRLGVARKTNTDDELPFVSKLSRNLRNTNARFVAYYLYLCEL